MGFLYVDGEVFQVFLCMFITSNVELCFFWKVFDCSVLVLVAFDVLKFQGNGSLVDFIGKVIVVGDHSCWVWNEVCLHRHYLLDYTIVVTKSCDRCRLREYDQSSCHDVMLKEGKSCKHAKSF